jgi:hypothetical protein
MISRSDLESVGFSFAYQDGIAQYGVLKGIPDIGISYYDNGDCHVYNDKTMCHIHVKPIKDRKELQEIVQKCNNLQYINVI